LAHQPVHHAAKGADIHSQLISVVALAQAGMYGQADQQGKFAQRQVDVAQRIAGLGLDPAGKMMQQAPDWLRHGPRDI
jgi:hypothetical protein